MANLLTVAAFAAGLALITAGVAFVYWPAGLVTGGLLITGLAWSYAQEDVNEHPGS